MNWRCKGGYDVDCQASKEIVVCIKFNKTITYLVAIYWELGRLQSTCLCTNAVTLCLLCYVIMFAVAKIEIGNFDMFTKAKKLLLHCNNSRLQLVITYRIPWFICNSALHSYMYKPTTVNGKVSLCIMLYYSILQDREIWYRLEDFYF